MTINQTAGFLPVDAYLQGMERLADVAERLQGDFARFFADTPAPSIRRSCERMIEDLLAVMDACDDDPDLEPVGDDEPSLGFTCVRVGMGFPNHPEPSQWDRPRENVDQGDDRESDDYDTEPSLGWTLTGALGNVGEQTIDCEQDDADAEDDGSDEPSLGSLESHPNGYGFPERSSIGTQAQWGSSATDDTEDEHNGREGPDEDLEPDAEGEPSLGSFDRLENQLHAWKMHGAWFGGEDRENDPAESGIGEMDGLSQMGFGGVSLDEVRS
jgi:hypothetical protein